VNCIIRNYLDQVLVKQISSIYLCIWVSNAHSPNLMENENSIVHLQFTAVFPIKSTSTVHFHVHVVHNTTKQYQTK
jgi:hypothetical protein